MGASAHAGQTIAAGSIRRAATALIAPDLDGELVGYVGEDDFDRLQLGSSERFHSDDPLAPWMAARVRAVDPITVPVLDVPALAPINGVPVAVEGQNGSGAVGRLPLVPVEAVYRIVVDVETEGPSPTGPAHVTRGVTRVEGEARSLAERFWRSAVAVLIREAAF